MNYKVTLFKKGNPQLRVIIKAKSYKQAASYASAKMFGSWSHARVVGKKVVRYGRSLKRITGDMRLFKTQVGSNPSLLLVVGNASEFIRFPSEAKRNQAYEEITCTTSVSAGSAAVAPEQTGTTALSDATNASSNGLTTPSIWSGSAENVTTLERLIRLSIGESFTRDSAEDTVKSVSKSGWKVSLSKSKKETLIAKIKRLPPARHAPYPGVNKQMKAKEGYVFTFTDVFVGKKLWWDGQWYYLPEWLEPVENEVSESDIEIIATVKDVRMYERSHGLEHDLDFVPQMKELVGKTLKFKPCEDHYTANGWCFAPEWLEKVRTQEESRRMYKKIKSYAPLPDFLEIDLGEIDLGEA